MNPTEALGLPRLQEGLRRLEPLLTASVVTGDGFLDEVTTHLIAAGGKRLRPLLALAAATGGGRDATEDDLMGGVAVELVHLASLYHDDVIDEATIRRNVESVNSRFGNLVAIVAGDYLLARSAAIAAGLGTDIAELLADTLGRLCQGQVTEVRSAFQISRSREDYFAVHQRQDGSTHRDVVPDRRADRRAACGRGRRPAPSSATASAWCSRSATTSSTSPPPTASCRSRRDRTWPRASTRCRPWWRWPTPTPAPTCGRCSGTPLAQPERDKARAIVMASRGHRASPSTRPAATSTTRRRPPPASATPDLRAGLSRLVADLLSDLPA